MKFKALGITFIVVVLAAIVAGVYFLQAGSLDFENWQLPAHKSATANWKTYANSEYGFEFKYPKDWTSENNDFFGIVFTSPQTSKKVEDNNENCDNITSNGDGTDCNPELSNFDFYLNLQANNNIWKDIDKYNPTEKIINVVKWTRYLDQGQFDLVVYVTSHNNNTIKLATYSDSENERLLIQTLSTFKFTDSNTQPQSGKGILTGHVTIGPNCPVERVDIPCDPLPEVYTSRSVLIFKADGQTYVTSAGLIPEAVSGHNQYGIYRVELTPGTYVIKFPNSMLPANKISKGTVTVKLGETTTFNFDVDTGIR